MSSISASLTANFSTQLIADNNIETIFIKQAEVDMINHFAAEYMQKIAGQFVYYIKIDVQRTKTNIYGETKTKIVQDSDFNKNGIKLPATVKQIVTPINDGNGLRYDRTLRVGFLSKLNQAYGVNDIFSGDFIKWNNMIYEIIQPPERQRMIFGQAEFSDFEIICTCKVRQ